jgi:hypothetical protein
MNGLRKCGTYAIEFYSAMKKNELLLFSSKWIELKNIILSEVSQVQKTKNRVFSLICRLFFIVLLFICAYKAWVISPPCPHPLPYHPLRPLPFSPTPSIPSRKYFALILILL